MRLLKLLLLITMLAPFSRVDAQQLSNVKPITPAGEYFAPVISPDGSKVVFTDHSNNVLYMVKLDAKGGPNSQPEKIKEGRGIGYGVGWLDDNTTVLYRKPTGEYNAQVEVAGINTVTREEKPFPSVHPSLTSRGQTTADQDLVVYINLNTLKLEAKKGNGKAWLITEENGSYYEPVLSPDGQSVIVHEGPNIYLYSVNGEFERRYLGKGLATSWTPDSRHILSFRDETLDGHSVSNSDLYFHDLKASSIVPLTSSADRIETSPHLSADGKRVVYADDKTGRIFIADLTY